jgi:type II secretory pathway pseudopilin PulG
MKNQKAFTLIETLVYLGLFTILMGGILTAAFNVFESINRDQTKITIQEEGNFLLAKINKALSEARSFNAAGNQLSVERWDGSDVTFSLSGTDLNSSEGGALNNSNVRISNLNFAHSTDPERITAEFTISATTPNSMTVSQDFFTVKYLHN